VARIVLATTFGTDSKQHIGLTTSAPFERNPGIRAFWGAEAAWTEAGYALSSSRADWGSLA
jgi:hypothetical protein